MPLLGFVTGRRQSSSNASKDGQSPASSIKDSIRKAANSRHPNSSALSVQTGFLGNPEELHRRPGMDAVKRHSLGSKLLGPERRNSSVSPKIMPHKPAKLWMAVESPPLTSYNIPANSSGALFSAQLHVDVVEEAATFETIKVRFICVTTLKKPVHAGCPDCTTQTTELKEIELVKNGSMKLKRGDHQIPFSWLFPGHLPATTKGALVSIDYFVVSTAKLTTGESVQLSQRGPRGEAFPLKNGHEVKLMRSVLPGNDKHSVRIFPPTNLTASVHLNPVIHPIGEFEVSLRLSGMTQTKKDQIHRWRLRKLNWRIEETQKMVSPACKKHSEKLGGENKGIMHDDVRAVGEGDVNPKKQPWKTDLDAGDVESMFTCNINPAKKAVCDAEAQNGMSVTHNLVLEMVVAEEWTPVNKPKQITPTGAARILRTSFHLYLTERPGLGVSWDEETPPVYEDVPESPPHYAHMIDYEASSMGSIEEFNLDPNTGATMTAAASGSGTQSRPGSVREQSGDIVQTAVPLRMRHALTADDFEAEPQRRPSIPEEPEEEEQEDVRVEASGGLGHR